MVSVVLQSKSNLLLFAARIVWADITKVWRSPNVNWGPWKDWWRKVGTTNSLFDEAQYYISVYWLIVFVRNEKRDLPIESHWSIQESQCWSHCVICSNDLVVRHVLRVATLQQCLFQRYWKLFHTGNSATSINLESHLSGRCGSFGLASEPVAWEERTSRPELNNQCQVIGWWLSISRWGLTGGSSLHPSKLARWWSIKFAHCIDAIIIFPLTAKCEQSENGSALGWSIFQPTPGWEWLLENEGSREEGGGSRKMSRRGSSKDIKAEEEEGREGEGMARRRLNQGIESRLAAVLKQLLYCSHMFCLRTSYFQSSTLAPRCYICFYAYSLFSLNLVGFHSPAWQFFFFCSQGSKSSSYQGHLDSPNSNSSVASVKQNRHHHHQMKFWLREGRYQASPKGRNLEVGARRAPRLLVYICIIFLLKNSGSPFSIDCQYHHR